jgi:hypothetical protein
MEPLIEGFLAGLTGQREGETIEQARERFAAEMAAEIEAEERRMI